MPFKLTPLPDLLATGLDGSVREAQGPPKAIRSSNTRFTGASAGAAGTHGSSGSGSAADGSLRSQGGQPCPSALCALLTARLDCAPYVFN